MEPINPTADNFVQQIADIAGTVKTTSGKVAQSVLIEGLPDDEYHADKAALSCSMLKPLLLSGAHFQLALTEDHCPTDAMELGTLVHLLALQPGRFNDEYVVYPGISDLRDKDYKEYKAKHTRNVIDYRELKLATTIVEQLRNRTYKGRAIGQFIDESITEATIYVTEPNTGLRLRIRMDIYHPDITFDIKTTRHPKVNEFNRDAISMHYDMQAFMYRFCRALYEGDEKGKPFVFLATETNAPFAVHVVTAGSSFIENGYKKMKHCLVLYKACNQTSYWPNTSEDATIEIEPWNQFDRPTSRS